MCVIIHKPSGTTITKRILSNCWKINSDGAGFMWAFKGILYIRKGFFGFKEFYKNFRLFEERFSSSDFVIHMRVATSGEKNIENCHPFYIKGKEVAYCHNGIFTNFSYVNNKFSDSYLFGEQILKSIAENNIGLSIFNNPGVQFLLEKYAKDNMSKILIMSQTGEVNLFNKDAGEIENGIWYSNDSYTGVKVMGFTNRYNYMYCWRRNWDSDEDVYDMCQSCKTWKKNLKTYNNRKYCPSCLKSFEKNSRKLLTGSVESGIIKI